MSIIYDLIEELRAMIVRMAIESDPVQNVYKNDFYLWTKLSKDNEKCLLRIFSANTGLTCKKSQQISISGASTHFEINEMGMLTSLI